MHHDELFLRTVDDLSKKINLGTAYDWLRSSALIRQLLLDGSNSLVDRVNREHRLTLTFNVPVISGSVDEHTMFYMAGDALLGVDPRIDVDLPRFLQTRLIFKTGAWFTAHDIVDTVGHALGGVHLGRPEGDSQEALAVLDASLHVLGAGAATAQMKGIGHITIVGLKPLVAVVAKKHGISVMWTNPGHVRQLKVIAPPEPGTRSVMEQTPGVAPFPFIIGSGVLNLLCGNCGTVLAEKIEEGQVSNIVFRCPVCSRYNEAA